MISLPDFTAAPVAGLTEPKSGIAPKELIGNVNFSQVLGGANGGRAGLVQPASPSQASSDTGLRDAASDLLSNAKTNPSANGKAFPLSGTALPNGLDQAVAQPGIAEAKGNKRDVVQTGLAKPTDLAIGLGNQEEGAPIGNVPPPVFGGSGRLEASPSPATSLGLDGEAGEIGDSLDAAPSLAAAPAQTFQANGLKPSANEITKPPLESRAQPLLRSQAQSEQTAPAPPIAKSDGITRQGLFERKGTGPNPLPKAINPAPTAAPSAAAPSAAAQSLAAQSLVTGSGPRLEPSAAEPAQATQIAQAVVQAGRTAVADMSNAKPALGPTSNKDQRVPLSTGQSAALSQNTSSTLASSALAPTPVLPVMQVEARDDMPQDRASAGSATSNGPSANLVQSAQTLVETAAQSASTSSQSSPSLAAAPVMPLQTATPVPVADTSAALRLSPQLENAIEQLAETRSAAKANRPEVTLRHQEFGAITMRLDASGSDLRATLSARDPGFVPAIQTALAERSVAASSDAASTSNQRGNEQGGSHNGSSTGSQSGSNSAFQGGFQGQGWNSGGHYGSSTGSDQGTSQPYSGQTLNEDDGSDLERSNSNVRGSGSSGDGEIFA